MLSVAEMRAAEQAYVDAGGDLNELTGRVGLEIARTLRQHFSAKRRVIAYLGKGYNAADALIALRHLQEAGWKVALRCAHSPDHWNAFVRGEFDRLQAPVLKGPPEFPGEQWVLLDALLGIGADGAPRGAVADLVLEINEVRASGRARVVAVDTPTGLGADSGRVHHPAVRADLTCSVGKVKQGLLADEATNLVGRIADLRIPGLSGGLKEAFQVSSPASLGALLPRDFDFHKGRAGRVAIMGGSEGLWGAPVFAARGALAAGAGLVTLYSCEPDLDPLQLSKPPEAMVKRLAQPAAILGHDFDCLVLGPGLLESHIEGWGDWLEVLSRQGKALVLDAAAIGLARESGLGARTVLTPHPGEMRRYFPQWAGHSRLEQVRHFMQEREELLLLKGARTLCAQGGRIRVNSTGGPGMSVGGQGDLLAGVIGGFLAGGMESLKAASLAAWLCGRAGERAVMAGHELTATTSDSIAHFSEALDDYQSRIY